MAIKRIEISNFRNIVRADVEFNRINIITGKNSSGKSNFLLALRYALSNKKSLSLELLDNVVTFEPGKRVSKIKVTTSDEGNVKYLYRANDKFYLIAPEAFNFTKTIDKESNVVFQELVFSGNYGWGKGNYSFEEIIDQEDHIMKKYHNAKVYTEINLKNETDEINQVMNLGRSKGKFEDIDQIEEVFLNSQVSSVKLWTSSSSTSSNLVHKFITEQYSYEVYEQVKRYLKEKRRNSGSYLAFDDAKFIFMLADIQRNKVARESLHKDLSFYTEGILRDISINTRGQGGRSGEINVNSPHGPKGLSSISTGTAILLYFVVIKNWINIKGSSRSYSEPKVMIFDEIDSMLHPTMLPKFYELLNAISKSVQLFISTHSPQLIDFFKKEEIFLMKDSSVLPKDTRNRCNIYSYAKILEKLPSDRRDEYLKMSNSDLFVGGAIEYLFP